MQTGRPPKPVEVKRLAGNPGKRKLPGSAPKPHGPAPRMPIDRLGPEGQLVWIHLKAELEPLGLLTSVDGHALESLCAHLEATYRLRLQVARQGHDAEGARGGTIRNPLDKAWLEHDKAFERWATHFGLSPSTRSRLRSLVDDQENESLADLLFEGADSGKRRDPLVELVRSGPARALAENGFDRIETAQVAARDGYPLIDIPGVGPATVRKLQGIE